MELHFLQRPTLADVGAEVLLEKTITTSDLNTAQRIILPKALVLHHFPELETKPVDLPCQDTIGNQYAMRISSWANNHSKMFVLEGAHPVLKAYKLDVGDSICLGRLVGGEHIVAGKRGPAAKVKAPPGFSKIVLTLGQSKRKKSAKVPYSPPDQPTQKGAHSSKGNPKSEGQQDSKSSLGPARPAASSHLAEGVSRTHSAVQLADGIFRNSELLKPKNGVFLEANKWTAIIDCRGQRLKAHFTSQEAAQEAYLAAGGA